MKFLIANRSDNSGRGKLTDILLFGVFGAVIISGIIFFYLGVRGMNLATQTQSDVKKGFELIEAGVASLAAEKFELASATFQDSYDIFSHLKGETWFVDFQLPMRNINDPLFDTANNLILAGQSISHAGISLAEIAKNTNKIPNELFAQGKSGEKKSITDEIKKNLPQLESAINEVSSAAQRLEDITLVLLPHSLRNRFITAKEHVRSLSKQLADLHTKIPAVLALLGDSEPHSFFILLQNNEELRPTGGFIGSFILAETNEGYITEATPYDVYHFDHQLNEVIEPPEEILPVNSRWYLRDSNYSRSFPVSAQKAAWFLEKEGGPSADTVVAIDVTFVEELLRMTGPIKIPELSLPLNADNFSTVITYINESKLTGKEDPKAIFKSFIETMKKEVFSRVDATQLISLIMRFREQRSIQAFSKNQDVQELFEQLDLDGAVDPIDSKKEDFLTIAHTNMGGNKTDRYMKELITHTTWINADGSVIDDLEIVRTHTWNKKVEARVLTLLSSFGFNKVSRDIVKVLGGSDNVHMVRIYVPKGSTLISTSAKNLVTKYDPELDLTYFSTTIQTAMNLSTTTKVRYKIPMTIDLSPVGLYSFKALPQPGQPHTTLVKRMLPDVGVKNYSYSPSIGIFEGSGVWNYTTELTREVATKSGWGK